MPRLRTVAVAFIALLATPAAAGAYFDVGKLPPPTVSGVEVAAAIESFSTTYAPRVTGTPGDEEAATYLHDEAKKLGYTTAIEHVPVADGADLTSPLHAVTAVKKGLTKPNEYILFMGHYDTVAGFGGATVNGAYDNASGTMMILALAKALANVPTNRSLMFIWYNGEEEGVLASDRHAEIALANGLKVHAGLGFDMVGIAYPVAAPTARTCLCMWHGSEDEAFEPLLRHVNFGVMGLPDEEGKVQVVGINERNSDESSWDLRGVPTLRWAGMRAAADYPAYHMPDDTMATIETVAGGRKFFEEGLQHTLRSAYLTSLVLDNEMPVAKAVATGDPVVTFDGSGSSDPDGSPLAYTWSFGDGTTGEGAKVTHAYAKNGTYTATLRVTDSLHPQVEATAAVPVTVQGVKTVAKKKKKAKRCVKPKRGASRAKKRAYAKCKRAAAKRKKL